ncbi:Rap1a/Tai family immunity protein [Ralstonia nicotianae]
MTTYRKNGCLGAWANIAKLLVCLMLLTDATATDALTLDGNFLLPKCTAAVRGLDGDMSADVADGSFCLGYVEGFLSGHTITILENRRRRKNSDAKPLFCNAAKIPIAQGVRIVTKFLNDNPQGLDLPMEILVFLALAQAFPCTGNKQNP